MKFFIDSALSPIVAERLREAGYDAVHTRDYDMTSATDSSILERAAAEQRVVVSADTDFGTQLAESGHAFPSVLLFRRGVTRRPEGQAELLIADPHFSAPNANGPQPKGRAWPLADEARCSEGPVTCVLGSDSSDSWLTGSERF